MAIIARIAHTWWTPSALRICAVLFLLSVCVPGSLFAQSRGVVTEVAPIYLRPDESRTPLRTAAVGTALIMGSVLAPDLSVTRLRGRADVCPLHRVTDRLSWSSGDGRSRHGGFSRWGSRCPGSPD